MFIQLVTNWFNIFGVHAGNENQFNRKALITLKSEKKVTFIPITYFDNYQKTMKTL